MRFSVKMTRNDWMGTMEIHTDEKSGAVWGIKVLENGYHVIGFSGKRNNPDFNYSFRTKENLDRYISEWLERLGYAAKIRKERAASRKAARAVGHSVAVGDIYSASWGYDQTNVDWYKVIKTTKCGATIVEIAASRDETGFMSGNSSPVDEVIGSPKKVILIADEPGGKWGFKATECSYASYCPKGWDSSEGYTSYA